MLPTGGLPHYVEIWEPVIKGQHPLGVLAQAVSCVDGSGDGRDVL